MADALPVAAPTVSVVVAHEGEVSDTTAAVVAAASTLWPSDALEIVLVDTGDPIEVDVEVSRVSAPGCARAAARNRGAMGASGFYVAFLGAATSADPGWIKGAIDLLVSDASLACAAPVVTDWDGRTAVFPTAGTTFDAHVRPGDGPLPATATDVLHPDSAALVVARSLFLDVGGFDERMGSEGEELDFGWRLWLLGHRVRLAPRSVVAARQHDPLDAAGGWYRQYLQERNALITTYKHLADDAMAAVLAGGALMSVRRGMEIGEVERGGMDPYHSLVAGLDDVATISRRGAVPLHALDDFLAELPSLVEVRADLQRRRQRSDGEILARFVDPFAPSVASGGTLAGIEAVRDALGLGARFAGRRRILVVTADVVGRAMAGPAIRASRIARALAPHHDVTLCSSVRAELDLPGVHVVTATDEQAMRALVDHHDVVITQGYFLDTYPFLGAPGVVVVVDLYDPFHLEQLEALREAPVQDANHVVLDNVRVLSDSVARADFALCASEKQRDFWLGHLSAARRVNPRTYAEDDELRSLLAVVPFGVEDEPPQRSGPGLRGALPGIGVDDPVLLWAGGIYNWFDPVSLIDAVASLTGRFPALRLVFMGGRHPNPEVPAMRTAVEARARAEQLGLLDQHVFFLEGWVPYDQRQNLLLDADIGVSTHVTHLETAFSFRTRMLDYFWAGLPIVCTEGDPLATLIAQRGAGLAVAPRDVHGLADAIGRVLDDDSLRARCRAGSSELGRELRWSRVLEPLVTFCRTARRAPDLLPWAPVPDRHAPTPSPDAAPLRTAGLRADLASARALVRGGGLRALAGGVARRTRRLLAP